MASIRCYHCRGTHESVAAVRGCATAGVPAASATVPAFVERPSYRATEKQVKFLTDLLERKVHNFPETNVERLAKSFASRMIDALLKCDDKPREAISSSKPVGTSLPDIAAGYYAVNGTEADGRETRFYRVDRPISGQHAGRTFLKVQSSNDFWPIHDRKEIERVLLEIAIDPAAAGKRYGVEIGRCCRCNRVLTDDDSRAAGIGPVCGGR